ncbi:MAG: thiamine pyrophosphate-requiring protein, partial [Betaproteobacteria bacterium]|nr:thiamine pyrophosphate-requiring protein [Betaproteobacteria bacterium]
GTANALCGLFNASRENIPMLFAAGCTPWTEGGVPGGRDNYINWAQEMFDQGALTREVTKWNFELRHPAQMVAAVDRALALAASHPRGPVSLILPRPVSLILPREVLAAGHDKPLPPAQTIAPASPSQPEPTALAEVAKLIRRAERPLIITSGAGRTAAAWESLSRFSERLAIPVTEYRPRFASLPTNHPMHCGYDPVPLLKKADLVLVLECDVPWIPDEVQPLPEAKIVHLGADPLFARYPLRGFRCDHALTGETAAILGGLEALIDGTAPASRRAEIAAMRPKAPRMSEEPPKAMSARWVTRCIDRAKDDDTILINEYPMAIEELTVRRHGTYFALSSVGALGWAMGAALGAKLARPKSTVIAAVGDGIYMLGNPTPFHFVSRAENLPVLTVIFNNRRWGAVHRSTLKMYPDGYAAREAEPPLSTLEPAPDYEKVVAACAGYGERVEDPADLPHALGRALHQVRVEKRQAVLNVITEIDYKRTS